MMPVRRHGKRQFTNLHFAAVFILPQCTCDCVTLTDKASNKVS
jgi:hypothetical protein